MTKRITFTLAATDGAARTGVIATPRGEIRTPAFMPVGTAATVKAMLPESVAATGADILLGNTYHLMLRPTAERIARLGGLHKFMNWDRPILTDSGGFQVMSLSALRKLTEEGVRFSSHIDGSKHMLSPERSMEIQKLLGSDIVMCFDECPALPATEAEVAKSMQLSMRWAQRSRDAFGDRPGHALFGIQQGGVTRDLRAQSAEALRAIGFDGYAVGGLAVGEGQEAMFGVLDYAPGMLPADKPRYLMGVGKPDDIVGAVVRGIDMMDCVLPSRSGRNGTGLDPSRSGQHQERAASGRSASPGRGLHLPGLPQLFPRLPAPRVPRRRDDFGHAADLAQPALLSGTYGGTERGDRRWAAGSFCGGVRRSPRGRRHPAQVNPPRGMWAIFNWLTFTNPGNYCISRLRGGIRPDQRLQESFQEIGMASVSFWVRADSITANNSVLNPIGTNGANGVPAFQLTFTNDSPSIPGVDESGDLLLDGNGGLTDPDTSVVIDGTSYSFTLMLIGVLPNNSQVPAGQAGKEVALISVVMGGVTHEYFFLLDGSGTQGVMNAFGNGAILLTSVVTTPPGSGPDLFLRRHPDRHARGRAPCRKPGRWRSGSERRGGRTAGALGRPHPRDGRRNGCASGDAPDPHRRRCRHAGVPVVRSRRVAAASRCAERRHGRTAVRCASRAGARQASGRNTC